MGEVTLPQNLNIRDYTYCHMKEEVLEELGLTTNESKIYLTLLELGKSPINAIAQKTGLHRRTIYDCLMRLEEKGLISYILEGKTRFFNAVSPQKLMDFLKEKEALIKQREEKIKNILPELLAVFHRTKEEIKITVHKGKNGLKTIFEDLLRTKKEWDSLISSGMALKVLPFYVDNFHKRRQKAKISYKVIFYGSKVAELRAEEHARMKYTEVKCFPESQFIPISTWIYGNKVVLMIWEAELGILIESRKVTESFRKHFEVLWSIAKPI